MTTKKAEKLVDNLIQWVVKAEQEAVADNRGFHSKMPISERKRSDARIQVITALTGKEG